MSDAETFRFHEFEIPVPLLNMTGGGTDSFDGIAEMHATNLRKFLDIQPSDSVLEIGCGIGRDAIPLTKLLSPAGRYLGIDIIRPSIEFCQSHISELYPHFTFVHFDVKDQLHNPTGQDEMLSHSIPLEDGSVDKVFAWSVLTHLWEADIRHYLAEFQRVMRPGAKAYLTCFVLSPEIIQKAQETNLTKYDLRFEHQISPHCFVNNPDSPLGAIGYTWPAIVDMVESSGLKIARDYVRGAWSGFYDVAEDGQDGLVLIKP